MGKKDPGEPDFGLRAHSTEWWGPVSGRPSGHPAGPIRGVVRTAVRPDSGVGPARFSAWPATGLATSALGLTDIFSDLTLYFDRHIFTRMTLFFKIF